MSKRAKKPDKKTQKVVTVKRKTVSKVKTGQSLSTEDVEKMFMVYVVRPVLRSVADTLHVSVPTVRKYRDRDKWDERRERILQDVRRKDGNELAKALTANLKIVRFAKAKLIKKVQSNKAKSTSTYAELDRMIRLEGFLLGQPDSRSAVGRFEHLTDVQLKEKLEALAAFRLESPKTTEKETPKKA